LQLEEEQREEEQKAAERKKRLEVRNKMKCLLHGMSNTFLKNLY
jgi:hypothetical protein